MSTFFFDPLTIPGLRLTTRFHSVVRIASVCTLWLSVGTANAAEPATVQLQWTHALMAILLIVLVIGLYSFRLNQRLKSTVGEHARTKLALEQALRQIERSESEQRQLLSMVSHEYRNPAAMIKASLDSLAILKDLIPPEVSQRLSNIGQASQRLNNLSNSLILHDRWQELPMKPKKQAIDLCQLVREVYSTYPAGETIQVLLPEHSVTLQVDVTLLGIALHNLLDNALRFQDAKDVPITISLIEYKKSTDPWIELRVADQGVGITDADKEKVFQRFYSTKGGASDGLGLSIVQAVASAHGGSTFVLDNTPHGAVFVIRLPVS